MPATTSYVSGAPVTTRPSSRRSIAVTRTRGSARIYRRGSPRFCDAEVRAALDRTEIVVVAITSNAIRPVIGRIADALGQPRAIVVVGKGFDSGPNGDEILLLPHVLERVHPGPGGRCRWTVDRQRGGPRHADGGDFRQQRSGALWPSPSRCSARPPTPSRPPTTSPDSRWRRR